MKVGIGFKVNVSNIDKEKLFKGEKGTYLNMTGFFELDELDKFGNSGMITQQWEGMEKNEGPILGNGKVFWKSDFAAGLTTVSQPEASSKAQEEDLDDLPF